MNEEKFLIQFVPSKNCFLQFSHKWFQKITSPKCSCLKLTHPQTNEELRFTCAPQPSFGLNDCSVGINATFAQSLNLQENDLVAISSEETLVPLQQVFLTPHSSDDYEILEMSRDNLELSLLDQVRTVFLKQVLVVWVSKTIHLKLSVDNLFPPVTHGRLEQMTELVIESVVKPLKNQIHSNNSYPTNSSTNVPPYQPLRQISNNQSLWKSVAQYLPDGIVDLLTPNVKQDEQILENADNSSLICRVHPIPERNDSSMDCCNGIHNENIHPFHVYIFANVLGNERFWTGNSFIQRLRQSENRAVLCQLESIAKKKPKQSDTKSEDQDSGRVSTVVVRLYKITDSCEVFVQRTNVSCVFVSRHLRHWLGLRTGAKVVLSEYKPPLDLLLQEIKLVPGEKLNESKASHLMEKLSERLRGRNGVLVNNRCPLLIPLTGDSECNVIVELVPSQLDCWPLTQAELQVCCVRISEQIFNQPVVKQESTTTERKSSIFEDLVREGVATVQVGLNLVAAPNQDMFLDNILITGKKGSGKTRIVESICSSLSSAPHFVHVSVLHCEQLKGKKPESIGKALVERIEDCLYYQPSVLVLEDLSSIAGVPAQDLEPSQEAYYCLRLAVTLKELLYQLPTCHNVTVIATAESRAAIHPQLCAARGRHSFTTFLHVPPLNKEHRLKILEEEFGERTTDFSNLDVEELAKKTEGCVAQDLTKLVDRIVFKSCQRRIQEGRSGATVDERDLEAALEDFVPSELANVSLKRNTSLTFDSVGGMQLAKQMLTEVLIWPTTYPEIFSDCPLRLERGVLLYGAPGTGKTLLANAVVGESRLNLITVKGPELLSKYIGASEEAVRNVFQKAQSAAPCVLFFDEFESLAPRRGHDSTGVTDRVVNQLLTQMDGVEALEGVWVLAAASRPDLLDPALLRPGRIGTLVHCTLPDQKERVQILQKLASKLSLTEDATLEEIAARTEGFTGADLQAVLFTAQMNAFEALDQDDDTEKPELTGNKSVVVSQADLMFAIENTSPSIKPEDSARLNFIYDNFQKGKNSSQSLPEDASLRVTLA